ncbi:hypothetical protein TREMEDRAFT_74451 [Tremella mesenterica DSM 1558]|uniref:uncharacterized protein n=1 Tax=Tremella mesenterica (strain ATCC 24925 / CBS 8224 / DSM 1558 / NBRC 9311 / NRRL Y-6157 / RJB 2259-6 / UBC 559-6) TaxID=578456 RepID=UPI0003F48D0E|nr:uncharacterized protein TREMEDRAFT_74451 [Tremella mesenterica DSM 1558]EIW67580.1 hypothetical protein TREMEDRAFT_74451 [Tremella mesenterica DSM 1558]
MNHPPSPFHRALFPRQSSNCISCDGPAPTCNCEAGQRCQLVGRTCNQCPTVQCLAGGSSSSGGGVNPGVIAGPVVAVLLIASLGLFWWLRRKKRRDLARLENLAQRARKAESAGFHLSQPSSPQPPSTRSGSHQDHLPIPPHSAAAMASFKQRSPLPPAPVNAEYYDENGALVRVYGGTRGVIDLRSDPFSDRQSVNTYTTTSSSQQSMHIIPIQYIPSKSDGESKQLARSNSAATRTLQEARQNLHAGAPRRPARDPDLDLRLIPEKSPEGSTTDSSSPSIPYASQRESFLSGHSGSSFLSGTTDIHHEAPRIVTSRKVNIGNLRQAEVVHFNNVNKSQQLMEVLGKQRLSPVSGSVDDPFDGQTTANSSTFGNGVSTPTFGEFPYSSSTSRRLTPTRKDLSPHESNHSTEMELEPPPSASTGDLRFSMGSLARDISRESTSSLETFRYLANPNALAAIPPPRPAEVNQGPRESMLSAKSYADSLLGAFPMIPPGGERPPLPGGLPQSMSSSTLENVSISRPPPAFRPPVLNSNSARQNGYVSGGTRPGNRTGVKPSRPNTAASEADSFLGSFPFVPPNMDDLAGLPSAAIPSAAVPDTGVTGLHGRKQSYLSGKGKEDGVERTENEGDIKGRNSTVSESGLGGFEFSFEGAPPLPKH